MSMTQEDLATFNSEDISGYTLDRFLSEFSQLYHKHVNEIVCDHMDLTKRQVQQQVWAKLVQYMTGTEAK